MKTKLMALVRQNNCISLQNMSIHMRVNGRGNHKALYTCNALTIYLGFHLLFKETTFA